MEKSHKLLAPFHCLFWKPQQLGQSVWKMQAKYFIRNLKKYVLIFILYSILFYLINMNATVLSYHI